MKKHIYLLLLCFIITVSSFGQMTTDKDWIYKDGAKFFPIGLWYPRGYNPIDLYSLFDGTAGGFDNEFGNFNTFYVDPGIQKPYMQDKVLIVGNKMFHDEYLISSPNLPIETRAINAATATANYWKAQPYNHIYMIDEPHGNPVEGTGWLEVAGSENNLYKILNSWNQTIKKVDSNSLTFLDFQRECKQDFSTTTPCSPLGLFSENVSYDIASHQHYDLDPHTTLGAQVNISTQFVRGLKTQTDKPSFLFLEADNHINAVNIDFYSKTNRAKTYSSIIHGATGVFFWRHGGYVLDNDYNAQDIRYQIWEETKELALELQNNQHIFKGELLNTTRIDDLHTGLFKVSETEYYYIVVNANETETRVFHLPNVASKTIQPTDVYITQVNVDNIPFLKKKNNDDILIRNSGNSIYDSKFYVALSNGIEFPYSTDSLWEEHFGVASQELKIGDFNGDGKDDLLIWNKGNNSTDPSKYFVSLSSTKIDGKREFKGLSYEWLSNFGNNTNELHVADFNGDGRDDLLIRESAQSNYKVMLSNGNKFLPPFKVLWEEGFGVASQELKVGDFNGDGKDDLLIWNKGANQSDSKYYVSLSNGIDEFKGTSSIWKSDFGDASQELKVGDFNDDGKDDILIWDQADSKFFVALSGGTSFLYSSESKWLEGFGTGEQELKIGDFNRDGKDDILIWKKGPYQIDSEYLVALSNGVNSFDPESLPWITNFATNSQELFVGDFDGTNYVSSSKTGVSKTGINLEKDFYSNIKFHPNPFKENVFIKLNLEERSDLVVTIFDINGKRLKEKQLRVFSEGEQNIDLTEVFSKLEKGVYIAEVFVVIKNTKKYKKIIKLDK